MVKVLVIGAGRGIGLETVQKALEAGFEVRAMARSADTIDIEHRNLEKLPADATSLEDVMKAVKDCDAVITTLGIGPTRKPVSIFSDTAKNVIQAMQENNVERLIAVTGMGAGNSKGTGGLLYSKVLQPMVLGPIYEDKNREEDLIQASNLSWTIVRPGILTRLPTRGKYHVLKSPVSWRGGFITRGDVADFLVKLVTDEEYIHETPMLVND